MGWLLPIIDRGNLGMPARGIPEKDLSERALLFKNQDFLEACWKIIPRAKGPYILIIAGSCRLQGSQWSWVARHSKWARRVATPSSNSSPEYAKQQLYWELKLRLHRAVAMAAAIVTSVPSDSHPRRGGGRGSRGRCHGGDPFPPLQFAAGAKGPPRQGQVNLLSLDEQFARVHNSGWIAHIIQAELCGCILYRWVHFAGPECLDYRINQGYLWKWHGSDIPN